MLSFDDGPMMTFDRVYGKLPFVDMVSALGYIVLTIATTLGSKHLFLAGNEVDSHRNKLRDASTEYFDTDNSDDASTVVCPIIEADTSVLPWTLDNYEVKLLGPELRVARH